MELQPFSDPFLIRWTQAWSCNFCLGAGLEYLGMKRGLTLALLTLATSVVASAQVHGVPGSVTSFAPGRGLAPGVPASVTSLGPLGFGEPFFDGGFGGGFTFGHDPRFITSFRHHGFHRHFFPVVVPYYVPFSGFDYGFSGYDPSAYQQTPPSQPVVVVVDSKSGDDRYGDHSFKEQRNPPPPQAQVPPAPAREQEPTVLVFRDGHKLEVRNYAIVGQMLWDFGANGTRKIPLSDLDLDSTRKLNDDRGVEFVLPKT